MLNPQAGETQHIPKLKLSLEVQVLLPFLLKINVSLTAGWWQPQAFRLLWAWFAFSVMTLELDRVVFLAPVFPSPSSFHPFVLLGHSPLWCPSSAQFFIFLAKGVNIYLSTSPGYVSGLNSIFWSMWISVKAFSGRTRSWAFSLVLLIQSPNP